LKNLNCYFSFGYSTYK